MLYIEVKTLAGEQFQNAVREMAALASKLGVCVRTGFNGVDVTVAPGAKLGVDSEIIDLLTDAYRRKREFLHIK